VRATGVKERVERAAIDLFAARGIDGVSIANIAGAAGVSQGALYRHYRGKDELAAQLFSAAYRRTGAELAAIGSGEKDFAMRIGVMIAHFCALYDRDAALFRFMLLAQHDLLPDLKGRGRRGDHGHRPADGAFPPVWAHHRSARAACPGSHPGRDRRGRGAGGLSRRWRPCP
jgi:AcrR family transcriptional regulator